MESSCIDLLMAWRDGELCIPFPFGHVCLVSVIEAGMDKCQATAAVCLNLLNAQEIDKHCRATWCLDCRR